MRNGSGGDRPENNLEAVRETLKRWPDTDTVLLIADNDAPVKDIALLPTIKKPVSVIVCGRNEKIHPDYIKIVQATGGKLFFLETEVQGLKNIRNGNRITVGKNIYEYQKGALFKIR